MDDFSLVDAPKKLSKAPDTEFYLATVAEVGASGVRLLFAGESSATSKYYKCLSSANVSTGDRVVVMKQSGTYIVMGAIGGPTVITDPTEVFTMSSGFECNWVYYAEWGKIAMVSASFKAIDAVTTTNWTTWATLTAGKRPPSRVVASFTRTSYCTVERNGEIQVSSTVNANTTYSFSAVYLLP